MRWKRKDKRDTAMYSRHRFSTDKRSEVSAAVRLRELLIQVNGAEDIL